MTEGVEEEVEDLGRVLIILYSKGFLVQGVSGLGAHFGNVSRRIPEARDPLDPSAGQCWFSELLQVVRRPSEEEGQVAATASKNSPWKHSLLLGWSPLSVPNLKARCQPSLA